MALTVQQTITVWYCISHCSDIQELFHSLGPFDYPWNTRFKVCCSREMPDKMRSHVCWLSHDSPHWKPFRHTSGIGVCWFRSDDRFHENIMWSAHLPDSLFKFFNFGNDPLLSLTACKVHALLIYLLIYLSICLFVVDCFNFTTLKVHAVLIYYLLVVECFNFTILNNPVVSYLICSINLNLSWTN